MDVIGGICSWLLGFGGLFWVFGKFGFGKLIFIKFIVDNINI